MHHTSPSRQNICILLVEDEDLRRKVLTEAMTDHGFEVFGSAARESAFLANRAPPPHLIVSDVNLGRGMNGFEFVTLALCRWPPVPVILMSDLSSNFDSRSRGATQFFLSKPFSLNLFPQNIIDLAGARDGITHPLFRKVDTGLSAADHLPWQATSWESVPNPSALGNAVDPQIDPASPNGLGR